MQTKFLGLLFYEYLIYLVFIYSYMRTFSGKRQV